MVNQFITDLKLHKRELLFLLLALIGFFTVSFLLVFIVCWADSSVTSWAPMGTIIGLLILSVYAMFNFQSFHQSFMLALSMGQTRKEFMASFALRQLLWFTAGYGAILLLYQLERLVYATVLPGLPEGLPISFLTSWKFFIPAVMCFVLVSTFCGALYSRFNKKFLVPFYFGSLGFGWSFRYLAAHHKEIITGTMVSWILSIPAFGWIILGAAVVIGMVYTVIRLGMKQYVH